MIINFNVLWESAVLNNTKEKNNFDLLITILT